jgi:Ca2+-binding EF-hand superfamily protein
VLDKAEAVEFFSKISTIIDEESAQYYSEPRVMQLFEKFDEDKNGYLDKSETALLMKYVFSKPMDNVSHKHIENEKDEAFKRAYSEAMMNGGCWNDPDFPPVKKSICTNDEDNTYDDITW